MPRFLLLVAMLPALASVAGAQGSIGVQGYGYPTGQLSSAALGIGGATAELDPASPLNPATIVAPTRYSLYLQLEPEFRRTRAPGVGDVNSRVVRFPAFMASASAGRFALGISFATFLDRSWSNVYTDSQDIGGTVYPSTLAASSNGAMSDARFALGYTVSDRLQVGAAVHVMSGENRLHFGRSFPDSVGLGSVDQQTTINFAGRAYSIGAVFQPVRGWAVGASARLGGDLTAARDGEDLAEASVPSRYGMSVAYFGIPNTTIAARFDRTAWTGLRDLGSSQMSTFDANEFGVGVDVLGPRVGGASTIVRVGARDRTLPFGVNGRAVDERAYSGGIGIPLARGRAQADVTLQRTLREGDGIRERSWFLSFGLGIRP